jgi:predicted nucleic-acid-binding Zn-ribbon protein
MKPTTCPKCRSQKIIPDVSIEDRGMSNVPWNLSVRVEEKPDALLFKGRHTDILKAWVCGECGYTELYVENPQALYAAYTKALERQGGGQ